MGFDSAEPTRLPVGGTPCGEPFAQPDRVESLLTAESFHDKESGLESIVETIPIVMTDSQEEPKCGNEQEFANLLFELLKHQIFRREAQLSTPLLRLESCARRKDKGWS